ncbi:MAG: hypothetical protein LPK80_04700 [Bacteroidota bacterium]|nr:hypothetical protein [Bacteroidota bacterium]
MKKIKMEELKDRFDQAISILGDPKQKDPSIWEQILNAYQDPRRVYHGLNHLQQMMAQIPVDSLSSDQEALITLALFFHDLVLEPGRRDNEERSADRADKVLSQLGISVPHRDRIRSMILSTRDHDPGDDDLAAIFCDLDLAILGVDPGAYLRYSQNVRKEYSFVPERIYRKERAKVIRSFLNRKRIFYSEYFRSLEGSARINLQEELDRIT